MKNGLGTLQRCQLDFKVGEAGMPPREDFSGVRYCLQLRTNSARWQMPPPPQLMPMHYFQNSQIQMFLWLNCNYHHCCYPNRPHYYLYSYNPAHTLKFYAMKVTCQTMAFPGYTILAWAIHVSALFTDIFMKLWLSSIWGPYWIFSWLAVLHLAFVSLVLWLIPGCCCIFQKPL